MDAPRHRFAQIDPNPWVVVLIACLVQLPLVAAPGYFSHDELQWAWRAHTLGHVPWWDDRTTFQFRPLTFNLWMALSRALFEHPHAFHAVLVAWGAGNAGLLCAAGRRMGMPASLAALGALGFVLTPYAVYVHGWIATLADLIWVTCALVLANIVLRVPRPPSIAAAAFVITAIALLGKEAAAAIPVACAVAWWFDRDRRARWAAALIGSGVATAAFLLWRMPALLHAPRDGGSLYRPTLANIPVRWIEYQVFPTIVPLSEVQATFLRPVPAIVSAVLWCFLFAALWEGNRRRAWLFVTGGLALLSPVLVLGLSANHYAYAFAALSALCVAAAWPAATRRGRIVIAAFAILTVLHGLFVMGRVLEVARVQSVFSPALARVVAAHPGDAPVRLRIGKNAKPWIFQRLTHEIPAYDGVPIGNRVHLVEPVAQADYEIEPDGTLLPLR